MHRAGKALEHMILHWRSCGVTFTAPQIQQSFDHWKAFLNATEGIVEMQQPKRHIVSHLLHQIPWFGNPSRYANWHDETCNRFLKKSCRTVSQATFEVSLLLRTRAMKYRRGYKRKYG